MSAEKNTHGGARKGAGRKATGVRRVSFSVSCQPEEAERVKELAQAAGKSVSRFLLDLAFGVKE